MINYVDADLVIAINNEECGQGVRDRNGVEAAVERPWATFGGVDFYPTAADKAGALFHGLASTQYFVDGNKRTAWLAATYLLQCLGEEVTAVPVVGKEAFVLATATIQDWDAAKAAEWFVEHRVTMSERLDYSVLALEALLDEPVPGSWSGFGISVAAIGPEVFPHVAELYALFRIRWRKSDIGRIPQITFRTEARDADDDSPAVEIIGTAGTEKESIVLHTGHSHHVDGVMPDIRCTRLVLDVLRPGSVSIIAEIDQELLFSIPYTVSAPVVVPSVVPRDWP